ncbi:MAG: CCA tRNA nucleotidyltransferase [Nanoarchaeota archaeon]|nr:CCA tRNA nucleotidyltransferase [Nanoarchaeota archaeon]
MIAAQRAEVVGQVLKRIKPSEEERKLLGCAVKKILEAAAKPAKLYGMKPILCGSVAKDTWLSPPDIDLFMLFPESLPRKKLEEYGLQAARDIFEALGGKCRAAYSEHPYLTGLAKIEGKIYAMDVVPAYETSAQMHGNAVSGMHANFVRGSAKNLRFLCVPKCTETFGFRLRRKLRFRAASLSCNIKSAVDRTPHHVSFVLKNLDYKKGQQNEARLLKKFAAARGCYGADLAVQGFSGYLCELLVIKFGTFLNVMENAAKWQAPTVVNHIEKKEEKEFASEGEPLIVPDPVDPKRNVAAAVSVETFYRFVKACREFEKTANIGLFEKDAARPCTVDEAKEEIEKRGTKFYAIRFPAPQVQPDIYHSQMRKALRRIEDILKKGEFSLIGKGYYTANDTVILLEAETWLLPNIKKQAGPSVFSRHAKSFLEHYSDRNIFIEDGNWVVILERKYSSLMDLLKDFLSSDTAARGIPKNIAKAMKGCELAGEGEFNRLVVRMPEDFRAFLRQYFEKDLNVLKNA